MQGRPTTTQFDQLFSFFTAELHRFSKKSWAIVWIHCIHTYTIEDVKTGGDRVHFIQISLWLSSSYPVIEGNSNYSSLLWIINKTTFSGCWIGTISSKIQNICPQLYLHDYYPLWVNENICISFCFAFFWLTNLVMVGILVLFTLNHDNESFAETLPQDNDTVNSVEPVASKRSLRDPT